MNSEEFLKKLEVELKVSKASKYTLRNYYSSNEKLLNYLDKYPNEITSDDIKLFLSEQGADLSSNSIILFLSGIRFAFLTILARDPTVGIKRPKKDRKIPKVLTKEEIKLLLNNISNEKSRLIVSLIYAAGLRVSEVVNLKLVDLDFSEKIGKIKSAKGKKDRFFNIPNFLSDELRSQIEKQQEIKSKCLFSSLT